MNRWTGLILTSLLAAALGGCPATTSSQGGTQVEVEGTGAPTTTAGAGLPALEGGTADGDFPAGVAPDVRDYLRAVHKLIAGEWRNAVLARASAMLPPDHPANQRQLVTEITVSLDMNGQPAGGRISQDSGYKAFDESAIRVMELAKKLPPLPGSIGEGATTLVWRFHRDERSCSPAYARLQVKPLSPEEAMQRSLARGQIEKAREILRANGALPRLLFLVAGAALAAEEPLARRAALQIASDEQIEEAIKEGLRSPAGWRAVLAGLAARKESRRLVDLLGRFAERKIAPERLVDLVDALAWLDARPDARVLTKLLARPEGAIVAAAAALVTSAALLDEPLSRAKEPGLAGVLAVRKRALCASAAEEAIRKALAGPGAAATLEAIARYELKSCDADLEALIKNGKAPAPVRARAIEILASREAAPATLYTALRDSAPVVQIAAARALARARGNQIAISHRLVEAVTRARGEAQAEALAALARIGDERFRDEALRRARHLEAKLQVIVAEALASYGDRAVPLLAKMLASPSTELHAAAARGLARIKSKAAERALAARPYSPPPAAAPSPIQVLVSEAVQLQQAKRK